MIYNSSCVLLEAKYFSLFFKYKKKHDKRLSFFNFQFNMKKINFSYKRLKFFQCLTNKTSIMPTMPTMTLDMDLVSFI